MTSGASTLIRLLSPGWNSRPLETFQTLEFITLLLFVPWEVPPVWWLFLEVEQMTKMLLRIRGDLEDIEMEDGTGLKPHISPTEKNLSQDTNIPQSLSELSWLFLVEEPILSARMFLWRSMRLRTQNGRNLIPFKDSDTPFGPMTTRQSTCTVDSRTRPQISQRTPSWSLTWLPTSKATHSSCKS